MSGEGVSVVVPTRGRAGLVEDLLTSLRPALEAYQGPSEVVLCDASDDTGVLAAAGRHAARVVRCPPGIARQRNAGLAAAKHTLIWFVDSDCVATAGALSALAAGLRSAPDAGGAAGTVVLAGPGSGWLDAALETGVVASFDGFGAARGERLPWAVTANLLLRRDALEAVGGFEESLPAGEDVDLGLRLRQGLVWCPDAVVQHRTETWRTGAQSVARFLRYGAADAHLLSRHPAVRGPLEPSVVNWLPLAAGLALLRARSAPGAAGRVVVWALLALVVAPAVSRPRHLLRAVLASVLVECLHLGRQAEAARARAWRAVFSGVVLDDAQRERERGRRHRTAAILAVAAVPSVLRRAR